jgi:GTPase-activating protein SAC7
VASSLKRKVSHDAHFVMRNNVNLVFTATDIEGIFRLSGSAKRIKDLQAAFNSPDRYGKGLDWSGYTVHDAANILRRYLNQLPEPIVPLEFYERFRDPLRYHEAQAVGDMEAPGQAADDFDHDKAVAEYQKLIIELPPLNRQLLLYILDLLAVFSSKSDLNRMTSANLSAIFQPGVLSHPSHDMAPHEYRLSQDVLIFLIENQDNFLIGMTGTAADEKTVKEVQSGGIPPQSTKANIGRSASNASAGADSLRKFGSVRRQQSVSSRNSRNSGNVPSPVTPSSGIPYASNSTGSGVHRSNTVPSKKSPALTSGRFAKPSEPSTPTSAGFTPPASGGVFPSGTRTPPEAEHTEINHSQPSQRNVSTASAPPADDHQNLKAPQSTERAYSVDDHASKEKLSLGPLPANSAIQPAVHTPPRERKISNLFPKSPDDARQPNKLRKKQRIPGSANESAQSSMNSLAGGDSPINPAFHTPMMSPPIGAHTHVDPLSAPPPALSNTMATPTSENGPQGDGLPNAYSRHSEAHAHHLSGGTLKPAKSPTASLHSKSSFTDQSDLDQVEGPGVRVEKQEKRRRWRFSSSAAKKNGEHVPSNLGAPPNSLGANTNAAFSNSSLGSKGPRKSFTNDSQQTQQLGTDVSSTGYPSAMAQSSQESDPIKDSQLEPEKRGLIGKIKAKMEQAKEARKEREAEKERAKSPPRGDSDTAGSRHSLSAFVDHMPIRGRSMDVHRDSAQDVPIEPAMQTTVPSAPHPQAASPLTTGVANAPGNQVPERSG